MPSAAKLAANRRNAKKSTGPKTLAGKKTSAANATRHAILSVVPVLPGVEKSEDWTAHRDGTIASLAPVGYLETVLADRIATLLWRLRRVTRYETENVTSKLETLAFNPRDFSSSRVLWGESREQVREEVDMARETAEAFSALYKAGPDEPFSPAAAEAILLDVASVAGVELDDVSLPFLPKEADDLGWTSWDGWTKSLVLQVAEAIVATAKEPKIRARGAAVVINDCRYRAHTNAGEKDRALRDLEADYERRIRSRMLLVDADLEKVTRYETHLERSLYKALHELQRLQAVRSGSGVVPMALDVDVNVGPRSRTPETLDTTGESVEP